MTKAPPDLPKDTVRLDMTMLDSTDLRVSIGWNVSDDVEENAEDNLRALAEGIMYLMANQIDDLIQIGINVEQSREEETDFEGNVIPFPPTPTRH